MPTKQSQHTPGPWKASSTWVTGETDDITIAQCSYRDKNLNESEANAHLIAAAPDMLHALELIGKYSDRLDYDQWGTVISTINAAIAKARGQEVQS